MIITFDFDSKKYRANLCKSLDISIPLREGESNPNCYYAEPAKFETIVSGSFIGSVKRGGSVNHQKVSFTPHGNSTHTECYGHLSNDPQATINSLLHEHHFVASVVSVTPTRMENGDEVILSSLVLDKIHNSVRAVIIRTLPNDEKKKTKQYSGTNPPYLDASLMMELAERGVEHLLVDLPSVDREVDGGKLVAHKAFWGMDKSIRKHATITELIYVPDVIKDGLYLLNLQIAPFELDAAPSKATLYELEDVFS